MNAIRRNFVIEICVPLIDRRILSKADEYAPLATGQIDRRPPRPSDVLRTPRCGSCGQALGTMLVMAPTQGVARFHLTPPLDDQRHRRSPDFLGVTRQQTALH
jgi:hypothetical protein